MLVKINRCILALQIAIYQMDKKDDYGLSNDKRKTVLLIIFVVSLIAGTYLYPLVNKFLAYVCETVPSLKAFLKDWEYLGLFSTQITVFVIFNFLTWIFNNYLWKMWLFQKLLKVPDLNGKWEGGYESIREVDGKPIQTTGTMVLSITQTWNKMACQSSFSKSESYSDVIYLDIDGPQGVVLKFTYTNKSHDVTCNLAEFSGYNELRLSDKNTLTGTYYTKRIPSTRGNLLLIRRSSNDVINETTG